MKISVITPCLNRKEFVRDAIRSVLAQKFDNFEHWIIDGGSTDGTLEMLDAYPHLKVLSEPDNGVYDALNKGIERATGDVVGFLNTDDQYTPGTFQLVNEALERSSALVFSGGSEIYQRTGAGVDVEMHRYVDPRRYHLSVSNVTLGIPNVNARFFRRSVFEIIGVFNAEYKLSADREFLLRAAMVDLPDCASEQLVYRYRWHADSLTMNSGNESLLAAVKEAILIAEIYSDLPTTPPADRLTLLSWRRELLATAFMARAVRSPAQALELAVRLTNDDPRWLHDLLRCGTLAVGRRIRTAFRKLFAGTNIGRGSGVSGRNRKIRVLHLIDSLDLGGAQTVLLALLQYHDRKKFSVRIASMHGTRKSLYYDRVRRSSVSLTMLSPRRWLPLYLIRLPLQLVLGRYDVIHCHLSASNWLGKPLARMLCVPVIISHDHNNDALRIDSTAARSIDRFANLFADRIFAVAPSIREYLISSEKIAPTKIRVIANGVAEGVVGDRGKKSGKVIGGAGRLVLQKNFDRFLRIARALVNIDSSYQFIIAGSGPLDQRLRKRANELGVRVEWLGVQQSLEVFFARIDLYLLTSDYEGLPMTLLEALQKGIPAAATAVDGVRETFSDEVLLLDPAAEDREIAKRIHRMLQNADELSAQIENGKRVISQRFSARARMLEIEQDYLVLLEEKRNRSFRRAAKVGNKS
jgi:glycosyltransferase involved in cell wall biosynthesis